MKVSFLVNVSMQCDINKFMLTKWQCKLLLSKEGIELHYSNELESSDNTMRVTGEK